MQNCPLPNAAEVPRIPTGPRFGYTCNSTRASPYAHAAILNRASRYPGRYDGEARRSRSRDRSPDRYNDRASQYSDGGPRRSSGEARSNNSGFPANRDPGFRDTLPRDTPRGPRALLDAPSGPRGGGAGFDRGRGRGRGRGWSRDGSRDRGRDRDIEFRDRRDSSFRDERSRERDRDWRDRESFRGRRPSPRGRSPVGRDFRDPRDTRDAPLGVDADRARRESRDGPLSAGSSNNSDPPFGPSSYRGGFNARGRGRGRGDWDRGRGRPFYEERDRERYGPGLRARSQEGRYRDRDDRDRDGRFGDGDARPRDARDDRDVRERDIRGKLDRTSHEPPPSIRDVSPPPVAPPAPSFGSVPNPNRTASTADISSVTGKPPPTGPRALKEERPPPTGPAAGVDTRIPPTGPSKPLLPEGSPPIPSGPRAQRPGPSSKQWINPNLKRQPESPKINRSQSFAQARFPGFRPDGTGTDQQSDFDRRPRSSDGKGDSQMSSTDGQLRELHITDSGDGTDRLDRRPQSAGSSLERHYTPAESSVNVKSEDVNDRASIDRLPKGQSTADGTSRIEDADPVHRRRPGIPTKSKKLGIPRKQVKPSIMEQSSDSDDEDLGDVLDVQISEADQKLRELKGAEDTVPVDAIVRHAVISLEAITKLFSDAEGLEAIIGPIPDSVKIASGSSATQDVKSEEKAATREAVPLEQSVDANKPVTSPLAVKAPLPASSSRAELPQPSIEKDVDMTLNEEPPATTADSRTDDGDVVMEDGVDADKLDPRLRPAAGQTNGVTSPKSRKSSLYPGDEPPLSADGSKRGTSTPSPPEDDDETDIDDIDLPNVEIVREYMTTPPVESLQVLDVKPWDKDPAFLKSMEAPRGGLDNFILKRLREDAAEKQTEQQKLRKIYKGNYEAYLRFTLSDDPAALKSREKFQHVPGAPEIPIQKPGFVAEPKLESTRRSRYASERDLERILEESRRVEDEKRERQARAEKEKYRSEKEAVLPIQYQTPEELDNDFYTDKTGSVRPEKLIAAWDVLPPKDNFTEEEIALFEKAYLEFPKQWGRVSDPLPNRDFGTSIQFYYLKKEKGELNLKEKLKKRPKQRKRGRGKQRSSALVSELGNGDNDNEENQETGENGERRRPRRAAAPTFNSEATPQTTDGENAPGSSTPSRRGAGAGKTDAGGEKPKRGRRAKDKEPKQPRANQALAAAPPAITGPKGNRSRSNSRAQPPLDWTAQQSNPGEVPRLVPGQFEFPPGGIPVPPAPMAAPFASSKPIPSPERNPLPPAASSISDVMAPPPLRPEPPLQQPVVPAFDINQGISSDRKAGSQASSYWSVPEATDFPALLRSFGRDWNAIASHMRTKTAVMVKNYYSRQKDNGKDWELIAEEAEAKKARGEKLPPPPAPQVGVKKRYDTSSINRPLAAADVMMDDSSPTKLEQPTAQSMTGRFNVPIAAQPQPTIIQSPFSQAPQPPALVQAHGMGQPTAQPLAQPAAQGLSPTQASRPLRAPFGYDREGDSALRQPSRTPLVQKPVNPGPPNPGTEPPSMRHPLPPSLVDPQAERQKPESKLLKEQVRQQERQTMRVKQEPDLGGHGFGDPYAAQSRSLPPRTEPMSLSTRPPEPPRAVAPAPQAPFVSVLQQQQGRSLINDGHPASPVPTRPMSTLTRPLSGASGGPEAYSIPTSQSTPPGGGLTAPRPVERKTSSIMSLLNDDPPPPPKRIAELPAASKPSSTPPPQANHSRPPPPPAPPSHVRQDSQNYGSYAGRAPPPAPGSAMPALKPYTTASPQPQSLSAPRHSATDSPADRAERDRADREYFARRQYASPHQAGAGSPQVAAHHYPPQSQSGQMAYQGQPGYPYGAPVTQAPTASSPPPPAYSNHPSVSRGHEPPPQSSRDMGWPGSHPGHNMQQQQQQQQQQQAWASQPPKSSQPPPAQSPWAAQHGAPKPPPPSSSVPPQPSWAAPRTHDPRDAMNLRDARELYPPHRTMQQSIQTQYAPASRAPEPPQQTAASYSRYNAPSTGRDPRDQGPTQGRSFTPVSYDGRGGYPPPGQELRQDLRGQDLRGPDLRGQDLRGQDMRGQDLRGPDMRGPDLRGQDLRGQDLRGQDLRDVQLREQQQQQSMLQQQGLRPQDRNPYERGPPDRYGR